MILRTTTLLFIQTLRKNSKKVSVKCLVMNGKLLVDALGEGDNEPHHLEPNVQDYVENGGSNYNSQYKNFGKLVEEINKEILSNYKGSSAVKASTQPSRYVVPPIPAFGGSDTIPAPGAGVYPTRYVVRPIPAFGDSDTFPAPGVRIYPTRNIGGYEGMLVGPRDSRFFPMIGGETGLPGGLQGVPPGARFDPYGPPGVPGFEPARFIRYPTWTRSGRNHPDLEHFSDGSDFNIHID